MRGIKHGYEISPRKDKRGIDLISDVLPFCLLSYGEPDAVSDAIGYAQLRRWFGIRVCSPYRHGRGCCTPKPGKKKQKRYDYARAVLIIHRFPVFFVAYTRGFL